MLWRPFKWQTRGTCWFMVAQVKVCVCGLGLLRPRLNVVPICDIAAEGGMCRCGAIWGSLTLTLFTFLMMCFVYSLCSFWMPLTMCQITMYLICKWFHNFHKIYRIFFVRLFWWCSSCFDSGLGHHCQLKTLTKRPTNLHSLLSLVGRLFSLWFLAK